METNIFVSLIMICLILLLVVIEYFSYDSLPNKRKRTSTKVFGPETDPEIDRIKSILKSTENYCLWRRSLLIGLISSLIVIYIFRNRLPTPQEAIVVTLIISVVAYFPSSWFRSHFVIPNNMLIEKYIRKSKEESLN